MLHRLTRFILFPCFALSTSATVSAHSTGESYIFLTLRGDTIELRVEMTIADANAALRLGLPEDLTATLEDVTPHASTFQQYVLDRLSLAPDGTIAVPSPAEMGLLDTTFGQFVQTRFTIDGLAGRPRFIDVDYRVLFDTHPEQHAFLVVENDWESATFDNEAGISLVFAPDATSARLDLSASSTLQGFSGMVQMGMQHIWTGIDHVLFLLALLLPSVMRRKESVWEPVPDLRTALIQVAKIITVFTVAHTVTLSLAALEVVTLPSRLVESVIAISIAVVAVDILIPMFRNWTYSVVLGFGLFHGFGFASVLADLPISTEHMVLSLLGFNLGVELGQLVIVTLAVPLLYPLRNLRIYAGLSMPAVATALIAISIYWFVERAFEIDLPGGAILNSILSLA